MTEDSYGTPLPKSVLLNTNSSAEELSKALTVNTFLLAVELNMQKNNLVRYVPEEKTAYITEDKFTTIVQHS
mgnify:CR=1 FL=1